MTSEAIILGLDKLIPNAIYRKAGTYKELEATWGDPRKLPSEKDIELVSPSELDLLKSNRTLEIDSKTEELFGYGVFIEKTQFPLDLEFRSKMAHLWESRKSKFQIYPIHILSQDRMSGILISDAKNLNSFYKIIFNEARKLEISGEELNQAILKSKDKKALSEIEDKR